MFVLKIDFSWGSELFECQIFELAVEKLFLKRNYKNKTENGTLVKLLQLQGFALKNFRFEALVTNKNEVHAADMRIKNRNVRGQKIFLKIGE